MNRLGPVELPSGAATAAGEGHLIWPDRHQWQGVAQEARRTLGGTLHLVEAMLSGGRPITLEARADGCWLSRATADALVALADSPGLHTLELAEYGLLTTVAFHHGNGPAVELSPLFPTAEDADYYTGTIRLIEVT